MRVAGWEHRNRGQAIQLGALLLFAILIINLSLFQIFVIPNQNTEIEFKHDQQVRSDMLNVRNAVLGAATGDQSFVEVGLAPTYPSRTLFVNPGQPAGTVRTTELQSITIVNDTTGDNTDISTEACPGTPQTRALEYRAGYNYYDRAPTYRIENTVLFREFGSETLPGSGQQLVAENTINLLPLRNEFSESGTGAATVEPVPGGVLSTNVVDPRIELPTEFDQDTWVETLEGSVPESEISVDESTDTLTLELSGSFRLNCGPIGVNRAPPSGARDGGLLGSGSDGGGGSINPASLTDIKLVDISEGTTSSEVEVTLKNKGDDTKRLARGRIPFYYSGGGQEPTEAVLDGNADDTLVVGADLERIDSTIEIPSGGTETLTFDFDKNVGNDFFVFEATFDDGTSGDYYIDTPKSQSGGGSTATATPSGSGFSSVSIGDIPSGSPGTGQTITFSTDSTLASGETVTIDLDNAQGTTGGGNPQPVDYQPASVDTGASTLQGGSATLSASSDTASVTYDAPSGGLSSGDTVTIELSGVETQSGKKSGITVTFSRSDGGSSTDDFSVT